MNILFDETWLATAAWLVIKASASLSLAAIVQLAWRRRASASTRHLVWTLSLLVVLLLPLASAVLPRLPMAVRAIQPVKPAAPMVSETTDVATRAFSPAPATSTSSGIGHESQGVQFSWAAALLSIYVTGAVLLLTVLLIQHWSLRRFARRSAVVDDGEWVRLAMACAERLGVDRPVRLLRTRERNVPMAFGTLRPAIMIPAIADSWDGDRRRAVLLHELAHVARYDCLTHMVAAIACAMYWFHPGVWWIARRVRIERELACDDRVIAAGTEPREYAGHLLDIAYSFGGRRAPALAVTMARPRLLEGRMLAALDTARNRTLPSPRVRLNGTAAAVVLLAGLAGLRPIVVAAAPTHAGTGWSVDRSASDAGGSIPDVTSPARTPAMEAALAAAGAGVSHAVDALGRVLQETGSGTWEIRPSDTKDTVHLRLVERNSSSGTNVPIAQLKGLTAAQLTGAGGPVQFSVERDAGTFTFEGVIRNGVGAGTFAFAPNARFPEELARRGFARPTAGEQYQLARHDVGLAFLDELTAQGYDRPQTSDLVRAGQHGVQVTYLREMGALGYRLGTLDPLITLRDHGVTPAYVRELAEQGYKGLAADAVREARDHGITPEYVRAMREAGYDSLPMNELIKVRDHGVTPDFVRELGDAGHRKLPLDQLLRVRDHGVSPEYVRGMRSLGYSLAIDDLVRARDHGVTLEYVRGMAGLGYGKSPIEALVRVRDHGVTPEYGQELKTLGYDKLELEDLVTLRDHGLTGERIRAANARAGTRLPIDMLRSLAAGGMR
jgi:beta-lactamase regulating signal transducer with metallopeptidase domain